MAGRLTRYRALLADRSFASFFVAFALGEAGYAVYAIGVLWLTLTVSGSAFVTGLVLAVEFGIYALSFLAGPFVDGARDLRPLIVVGYVLQGGLAATLGGLALSDRLTVPLLLLLVVALSIVWDFTWTALNALPPRIVPKDRLFLANGLVGAASGGNQIAGYAGGAVLLLLVGSPGAAMLLYGGLNVAAALAAVPLRAPGAAQRPGRFLDELADGWRHVLSTSDPPLVPLVTFNALQAFFSAAGPLLITVLTYRSFVDPARAYAILFSAFAFGGVAGSLALGEIAPRRRITLALVLTAAAEGLLLVVALLAAPSLGWSLPAWAAVGFVDVAFYETVIVFLQASTPTALLGRTLSDVYLFRGGSRAIGALVLGALLTVLAPGVLGVVLAVAFVSVALGVPAALPKLRRLAF